MTAIATPRHRVSVAVAHVHTELDQVVDASMWSMDPAETAAILIEVARLRSRLTELEARADELQVGTDIGATSTANWLAHAARETRPAAARTVRLGYDLGTHDHVRTALAHGDLRPDQAQVIVGAVQDLPEDLDPDLIAQAEQHLVTQAAEFDAKTLRILGRRLLDVAAPETADQHEADLLAKGEAKATQACRLTMTDDGHGKPTAGSPCPPCRPRS